MATVADCLRQHGPAYLEKFGDAVPLGHRRVLSAITRCRTGELGGVRYECTSCGHEHWVGRSCGNRHCPACGAEKTARWLVKQSQRLLPVHHFLVTFTVPEPIRSVLRAHQRGGYTALFSAAAETIRDVASATRELRDCRLGYFGVLHTWGRDPTVYHPHVHFVVPGGGVSADGTRWCATATNFLMPHATAVRVYKAKLADALRAAGLYDQVPAAAWQADFVVDIKPIGDGRAVLKYLAPYVHRVAISDARIVSCDEQSVTFRYTPSGTHRSKVRTVDGQEFVRGFLQHVLPRGLQKVRYYGWMSASSRSQLDAVKWLVWLFLDWVYWLASGHAPQEPAQERPVLKCIHCGAAMRLSGVVHGNLRALLEHGRDFLDSS